MLAIKHSLLVGSSTVSVLALLLVAGCQPAASPTGTGGSAPGGATPVASAGRAVYDSHQCANCHSINGQGGRSAPDLSKVASNPSHTTEWLVAHVKNPKAHNPDSKMPPYEGKISDADLVALGGYLATLK